MVYSAKSDDSDTISQFTRRKAIKITTGGTSPPADYQVKVTIAFEPGMQSLFQDIRFNTKAGVYIDYWIESKVDSDTADVWVELPNAITDPGSDTIWMYYGNAALSDGGVGDDTFEFYDDFNDASLNTDKWNVNGDPALDGVGSLKIGQVYSVSHQAISKVYQIGDGIIEYRVKATGSPYNEYMAFVRSSINTGDARFNAGTQNAYDLNAAGNEHCIQVAHVTKANHAISPAANTWYNQRFTVNGVVLKSERFTDETWSSPLATISYTDTSGRTSGYIGLATYGARQGWYDFIRIRKYIANEPITSVGTSQHQRRAPQFM